MKRYDGTIAVVTGASSGIGRRIAVDFTARGATVIGMARLTFVGRRSWTRRYARRRNRFAFAANDERLGADPPGTVPAPSQPGGVWVRALTDCRLTRPRGWVRVAGPKIFDAALKITGQLANASKQRARESRGRPRTCKAS